MLFGSMLQLAVEGNGAMATFETLPQPSSLQLWSSPLLPYFCMFQTALQLCPCFCSSVHHPFHGFCCGFAMQVYNFVPDHQLWRHLPMASSFCASSLCYGGSSLPLTILPRRFLSQGTRMSEFCTFPQVCCSLGLFFRSFSS